jgi:DNA helicase IV
MVRVFPIEYIKGMEFEAAFFHNLHLLNNEHSTKEMIMKNLYVGLSRASFYLAVTSNTDAPEFNFLNEYLKPEDRDWRQ